MTLILPPPRRIPVVPRPRQGELSGSYLARVAHANRTDLRSFLSLLGALPPGLTADGSDLSVMVLTLNDASFARLLAYTGLDGDLIIKAIPSLAPRTRSPPGEPPAIRLSFVKASPADCPGCRMHRDGACADTRLFSHKTACLRHGYWLYGQGGGQRLNPAALPEVRRPAPSRPDNFAKGTHLRDARLRNRQRLSPALMADQLPPVLVSPLGGTLAATYPRHWRRSCPHHLATARLGGPLRVHRAGGHVLQPILGSARCSSIRPTTPAFLPASARGTRNRQQLSPADHEALRSPPARHSGTSPLGTPPERPGLGRAALGTCWASSPALPLTQPGPGLYTPDGHAWRRTLRKRHEG